MVSKNQTAFEAGVHGFTRSWARIGRNLYRIYGNEAERVAEEQAKTIERSCQAEIRASEERLAQTDAELEKVQRELDEQLHAENVTEEKAKSRVRGALFRLALASLMVLVGICIIAWSLGPFFYGNEVLWLLVSTGSGLAIFICMEIFLKFTERVLNPRQFSILNALVAAIMVALFIAGFIQMSQARALQLQIQQQVEADSMTYDQEMVDIDKAKNRLNDLAKRAMIFLFIGFEWLTGVFFYLAAKTLGRFGPIVRLAKRRDKMIAERTVLVQGNGFLESSDSQSIKCHLLNGIELERTNGSLPLMVAVLVIILGVCIGAILLAEDAFGGVLRSSKKQCTYYLVGYDVTGSTQHDQQENQRAIIKIISSLQPCDEFQLMNITQDTFSAPEYMIHHRMPSKAGYFEEEIRRHRLRLIREFRSKAEKICKKRPATSLIEGLYMFSHLLHERQGMRKRLIVLSDMLQFSKEITPARIASRGDRVLEQLRADGLVPDMSGIEIYVMGASTAGIDARTWTGVKRFWVRYFKEAGAYLKSYSIQRHWPLD